MGSRKLLPKSGVGEAIRRVIAASLFGISYGEWGTQRKSLASITIADVNGSVWLSAKSEHQLFVTCDISRLRPGSYMVSVTDGNAVKTVWFIKE